MNRDAVMVEVPAAVADWLDACASEQTWRGVAHDVAWTVAQRVLVNRGEGGWNLEVRRLLEGDSSLGVRAVVAGLPTGPRRRAWSARSVADLACARFGLANAGALRRAISPSALPD